MPRNNKRSQAQRRRFRKQIAFPSGAPESAEGVVMNLNVACDPPKKQQLWRPSGDRWALDCVMSHRGNVSPPAATMSSVQALREFINERLTAAAGEIFTVFEQTMVQYEEEIGRQRKLLEKHWKPQIKFHRTESPEQHIHNQKTSSSLEQEEHEAPHIKEEEDVVEVTVTDGESDDSHDSVKDLTSQRLTAAAGEIFTMFEQTVVQYKEEIVRQRRLLEIIRTPQIELHRTELQEQHDCRKEQLCNQETNYCLEEEEAEPPQIKEEPELPQIKEERDEPEVLQIKEEREEPELLQIKEEKEEPETSQIEEHEELGTSQEGAQFIMMFENDSFRVPSVEVQSYLSEPDEEPDTEQFLSHLRTLTDDMSCVICGKSYMQQNDLISHMRTHAGEKPYSCETCEKRFTQRRHLLHHMRIHTGEKPYSCETCGKSFTQRTTLLRHMQTHTGEKPHSCETCGKSFSRQSNLLVHMRTHTGEKPYSCETCGKNFSQQHHLFFHIRTHTGEKPYSCETCEKSFSRRRTLLLHMRTHTGEKPCACETCGKSFSRRGHLLDHMRTHTGEKPYPCETCGKSFSRRGALLLHMKTHS